MLKRALLLSMVPTFVLAQGALENPAKNATDSGIGVVSGWHCTANEIEIRIDSQSYGLAGSGTERPDTQSVCNRTDTGFSLLFNYGELSEGSHSVAMYADGELFAQHNFRSVKAGGENFSRGLSKSVVVDGFPDGQSRVEIGWSTAKQSFVVTEVSRDELPTKDELKNLLDSYPGPTHDFLGLYRERINSRVVGGESFELGFSFSETNMTMQIDPRGFSPTCRYTGPMVMVGNLISSKGSMECSDFTKGTFELKDMYLDQMGVLRGMMTQSNKEGIIVFVAM